MYSTGSSTRSAIENKYSCSTTRRRHRVGYYTTRGFHHKQAVSHPNSRTPSRMTCVALRHTWASCNAISRNYNLTRRYQSVRTTLGSRCRLASNLKESCNGIQVCFCSRCEAFSRSHDLTRQHRYQERVTRDLGTSLLIASRSATTTTSHGTTRVCAPRWARAAGLRQRRVATGSRYVFALAARRSAGATT